MVQKEQQKYSHYINKGENDNTESMLGAYPQTGYLKPLKDYDTKPDCINFDKIKNSHIVLANFIPAAGGTFFSYLVAYGS